MIGYELVFITDPSHNKDEMASVLKNFKKILSKSKGELIHEYVWGRRRLAYEISGNEYGVYHAWYFTGTGKIVEELQRQIGYSADILRHQIIKTDDIDTEAAFLQTLIPPKEEGNNLEIEEDLEETEQIIKESKESIVKNDLATENENTAKENVLNNDIKLDIKIENSDKKQSEVDEQEVKDAIDV